MIRFLPYLVRCLWRHRGRTILAASGSAAAFIVFTFVAAAQNGLYGLTQGELAERTLIVFQANRFCPATSKLPEDYAQTISKLPGVADVVPIKVYTNNCRASLDVVVFHGMPPSKLSKARQFALESGDLQSYEKRQDAALVGRALARRRGLVVGSQLSIGPLSVNVAGVFRSPNPSDESFVFTHLDFLQRTRGLNSVGTATQFEVTLASDVDPKTVARSIDDRFRGGPVPTDTRPLGAFKVNAVGDLVDAIRLMGWLGYACVGLVLALVGAAAIMTVQDRMIEHAVLQAIGCTPGLVFALVVGESTLLSAVGGGLGVAGATVYLHSVGLAVGTEAVLIPFDPTPGSTAAGLVLSALAGIAAGLVPAIQAARAEIVPSLRCN